MEEDSVKQLREQVQALESELALTQASLTNTQNELTNTQNELSRLQRLYNRLNSHYEGLTKDYESVSQRLHGYKQAELSRVEVGVQTDPVCCEDDDKTTEAAPFPESSATNDDSASIELPDSNHRKEEQSSESLADGLRSAAEEALGQTGFVFDERTGLYYDYSSGYYYDAEQGLYFDYQTGTYFYYDAEQQEYKFHSQVDMETYRAQQQKLESAKTVARTGEGEPRELEDMIHSFSSLSIERLRSQAQDLSSRQWPSCIRVMVTSSDSLDVGSLFIITYTGATIGREKDMGHTIRIPDLQTSKMHAEVTYTEETRQYFIKDHASQNGTFVNDVRITQAKVMGEPYPLTHGDRIVIGGTHMLFHIHPGSDTCDECEPGQVQAKVQKDSKLSDVVVMTKKQREAQRRKELKNIKKKFGLANTAYVDNSAAIKNPAYQDRTAERQRTVGSDNPYQKDDAPASVHRAIPAQNKGHKLLQKMGWKEGDSLGKDQTGRKEPIKIQIRTKKTAGLGSSSGFAVSDIESMSATSKWVKAQERFENINNENVSSSGKATGWVQGQTLHPGHEDS